MAETLDLVIRAQNQANAALNGLRGTLEQLNKDTQRAGAALSLGVSAPFALFAKTGLETMGQFSQSMAQIEVLSGANEEQLSRLTDTAIRLGAETSFSANEAAGGMLELLKAGLDTEQTLAAIPGVLSLAAAGGVDLATSASVTAAALNTFGLEASQAEYVANLLAAAANSSSANISDLAMGLQQGGFAFNAAGQDVDDLAASLAILTNVGLTGSDAGTALKNAFMRMISPTKQARGVMDELGISFFDAQGNMRPLSDIIANLNEATAGLTEEQRLAALETIFLSDGMKGMIPLLNIGEDGFLAMKDAVNEAGAAQKVADARMRGFAGAVEYASGSLESAMLKVWQPFEGTISALIRRGADLITWLSDLPRPIINAALAFTAVLAAAGPLLLLLPQLIGFFAAMATPVGWVVLAVAALAAAWASNFGGIRDTTIEIWNAIQPKLQALGQAAEDLLVAISWIWQGKGEEVDWWWDIAKALGFTGDEAVKVGDKMYDFGVKVSNGLKTMRTNVQTAIRELQRVWAALREGDTGPLLDMLNRIGQNIKDAVPRWRDSIVGWVSGAWGKLSIRLAQFWGSLSGWISSKVDVLYPLLYKWAVEFGGWAGDAWAELSPKLTEFWGKVQNWIVLKGIELKQKVTQWASSFLEFPQGLTDAIAILQSEWDEITPIIENHVERFKDAFSSLQESLGPLQDAFGRLFDALRPWFTGFAIIVGVVFLAVSAAISALLTLIQSVIAEIGPLFTGLVDSLATQVEIVNSTFEGMVALVTALINGDWAAAWEAAKQVIGGFVATAGNFFVTLWLVATSMFNIIKNTVIGILEDMGVDAKGVILNMRTAIRMSFFTMKTNIESTVAAIKTSVLFEFALMKLRMEGAINDAKDTVIGKFEELKSGAETIIDGLRSAIEQRFNGIKSWIEGLTFTNPFSQVMGWAQGAINAVENAVGKITGAGGGASVGKASGTMHWRGGPVTLNERGTELIALPGRYRQTWLPRGTKIFPAEQVPLMAGGGGTTVNLYATVTGEADEERLAWRVANIIRRNS